MLARMIGNVDTDGHGEKTISLIGVFLLDCSVLRYLKPLKLYRSMAPESQPIAKYSRFWFSLIDVMGDLVLIRNSLCFTTSTGSKFIRQTFGRKR